MHATLLGLMWPPRDPPADDADDPTRQLLTEMLEGLGQFGVWSDPRLLPALPASCGGVLLRIPAGRRSFAWLNPAASGPHRVIAVAQMRHDLDTDGVAWQTDSQGSGELVLLTRVYEIRRTIVVPHRA